MSVKFINRQGVEKTITPTTLTPTNYSNSFKGYINIGTEKYALILASKINNGYIYRDDNSYRRTCTDTGLRTVGSDKSIFAICDVGTSEEYRYYTTETKMNGNTVAKVTLYDVYSDRTRETFDFQWGANVDKQFSAATGYARFKTENNNYNYNIYLKGGSARYDARFKVRATISFYAPSNRIHSTVRSSYPSIQLQYNYIDGYGTGTNNSNIYIDGSFIDSSKSNDFVINSNITMNLQMITPPSNNEGYICLECGKELYRTQTIAKW